VRDVKGTATVPVVYTGSVPDQFRVDRDVYLKGRLRNGIFVGERNSLVTKCPSKYSPKKA
jgi:cytochrome c-type biogenesis protein CcmE